MGLFQTELRNRYQNRCIVTQTNFAILETNHLIPRHVCKKINRDDLTSNVNNGTLLSPELHKELDSYYWSFDVNAFIIDNQDPRWSWVPIVVLPDKKRKGRLKIEQYQNNRIRVATSSLSYLWVNFQVFLSYNYEGNRRDMEDLYIQLLQREEFHVLLNYPQHWAHFSTYYQQDLVILDDYNYGKSFLVLNRCRPWSEIHKILAEDIPESVKTKYFELKNQSEDQDFTTTSGFSVEDLGRRPITRSITKQSLLE